MKKILVVLEEPFADPARGISYSDGLVEIEERYEKRARVLGLKFRYPTAEEAAQYRDEARAGRSRGTKPLTHGPVKEATDV